jgi:hypothetical protein
VIWQGPLSWAGMTRLIVSALFVMDSIMHGSGQTVLGIFAAPDAEKSIKAVSNCLLRIHSNHEGLTWGQIATALGYKTTTPVVECRDEKSMLGFEAIARIAYIFPDEFAKYIAEPLWGCRVIEQPTIDDRLDAIEREVAAIRKEAAE